MRERELEREEARKQRERGDSAKLMAKNHLWAVREEDKVMPMTLFR